MRKRNLSVYDIRRELAAAGHDISINALADPPPRGGLRPPAPTPR